MSDRQPDIPFRRVLELCERHGYVLMRIVGPVRVFWNPRRYDPSDARTWVSIEVGVDGCVKPFVYCRLREFLQDHGDDAASPPSGRFQI